MTSVTAAQLTAALASRGWQAAVVPASRVIDLRAEIESRRPTIAQGVMAVVDRNLGFDLPERFEAGSLVVVAVPHGSALVTLTFDDEPLVVPIPTTYCHHDAIHDEVVAALRDLLCPWGHDATAVPLPEKALAVCTGLAWYGRNNIAYVAGAGSYAELVACATDACLTDDHWTGPRALPRCEGCSACTRACPTGAIDGERFLLHGERCLTLHNESEEPFPAWLDPAWHHCLVGCLRCQEACPENLAARDEVAETAAFDRRETRLLLADVSRAVLAAEPVLRDKLDELGLLEYDDVFLGQVMPRNLRAAVAARRSGAPRRGRW